MNNFFDLSGFPKMIGTWGERVIINEDFELNGYSYCVDTCFVTDIKGYVAETAIAREGGNWYVVKWYKTEEEAKLGHKQLVENIKNFTLIEIEDITSGEKLYLDELNMAWEDE